MATDLQPLGTWIVLRIFAAFFVTLIGLAMLFGRSDPAMFLGALFTSIGFTFFALLWLYGRRS
jgi:hypothetical protein